MDFFLELIDQKKKKKKKDEAYIINPDEYANVGTHWIALFCVKIKLFQ